MTGIEPESSLYNARVLSCIVSSENQPQFFLMPTDLFQFNFVCSSVFFLILHT